MVLYNSNCLFKDIKGQIYSCDMVRLKGYLADNDECEVAFERYFNDPLRFDVSDVITRLSLGTFKYLWIIQCKHTSITVLHHFNSYTSSSDDNRMTVLEFNPNKLELDDFRQIDRIISNLVEIEIVRCDLAVDIPISRQYVHLIKDNRTYEYQDHNKNGITEYLGTRNSTNYVKVYDKTRESSLDEAITRVEFTCEPNIYEFRKHIPSVLIEHEQIAFELLDHADLSSSQKAIVSAVMKLPFLQRQEFMKGLTYRMRKKLSPFVLADTDRLGFDFACVGSVFNWLLNCVKYRTFTLSSQQFDQLW